MTSACARILLVGASGVGAALARIDVGRPFTVRPLFRAALQPGPSVPGTSSRLDAIKPVRAGAASVSSRDVVAACRPDPANPVVAA